jgi:uncharacterized protein (UPF0212 family)
MTLIYDLRLCYHVIRIAEKVFRQQRNEDVARLLKKNVGARFVMKSLEILGIIN